MASRSLYDQTRYRDPRPPWYQSILERYATWLRLPWRRVGCYNITRDGLSPLPTIVWCVTHVTSLLCSQPPPLPFTRNTRWLPFDPWVDNYNANNFMHSFTYGCRTYPNGELWDFSWGPELCCDRWPIYRGLLNSSVIWIIIWWTWPKDQLHSPSFIWDCSATFTSLETF